MLKRLNNQSGASLVFVLAAMLMLLSIGGSAMAAATSSRGAVLEKRALNQLHLLADSVQKTVGSQLTGPMDLINEPEKHQLVDTIIREIAKNVEARITAGSLKPGKGITATIPPIQFPMTATLNIPGLPQDYQEDGDMNEDTTTVTLNLSVRCGFTDINGDGINDGASITGYRGTQWERKFTGEGDLPFDDALWNDEIPQKLEIINCCEVMVEYTAHGQQGATLTTTATYVLPNITIEGKLTSADQVMPILNGVPFVEAFLLNPLNPNDADENGVKYADKYIDAIYAVDEETGEVRPYRRAETDPSVPWNRMRITSVTGVGRAVSYEKKQNNPDGSA